MGAAIGGSNTYETKTNKENMTILSTVKEKYIRVWARVQGEEKSITDYVPTDTTSASTVKQMQIDEEKQHGLHKLEKNTTTNENEKVCSDHSSILSNLDFEIQTE